VRLFRSYGPVSRHCAYYPADLGPGSVVFLPVVVVAPCQAFLLAIAVLFGLLVLEAAVFWLG
jgi:hypothetical protein